MKEIGLHDLYYQIVESAVVAIGLTDKSGRFILVNKAWCRFMGYNHEEALKITIQDITPATDIEESISNYNKLISKEIESFSKIKQYKRKDETFFWADLSVSAVIDESGQVYGVLGVFINIDHKVKAEQYQNDMKCMLEALNEELMQANTEISRKNVELQKAYEDMENLARIDVLTKLYNRRVMEEILAREVNRSRRSSRTFFIAIADIDNFKSVNDTYGHEFGDYVLSTVANIFRTGGIRATDYVGRWGGEEFLFVLTETNFKGASTVLERIRADIASKSFEHKGKLLSVSVTIGFTYQKEHYIIDELISEADQALYKGKKTGKNKIVCYYD